MGFIRWNCTFSCFLAFSANTVLAINLPVAVKIQTLPGNSPREAPRVLVQNRVKTWLLGSCLHHQTRLLSDDANSIFMKERIKSFIALTRTASFSLLNRVETSPNVIVTTLRNVAKHSSLRSRWRVLLYRTWFFYLSILSLKFWTFEFLKFWNFILWNVFNDHSYWSSMSRWLFERNERKGLLSQKLTI